QERTSGLRLRRPRSVARVNYRAATLHASLTRAAVLLPRAWHPPYARSQRRRSPAGLLALSRAASAGPPPGLCRHHSRSWCENALEPYAASRFLAREVDRELRARFTDVLGPTTIECRQTPRHTAGFYRCSVTVARTPPSPPCTVEALLSRQRHLGFRFHWRKEGVSCRH